MTHLHQRAEEWSNRSDGYVATAASNAIISIDRKRIAEKRGDGRVASLEDSDVPAVVPGPPNCEIAELIQRAAAKFSPHTREYLQLRPRFGHRDTLAHLGFSRRDGMAINVEIEAARKKIDDDEKRE